MPDVPVYYELSLISELANLGVTGFVTIKADSTNTYNSIVDYHNKKLPNFTLFNQRTYGNGIIIYRKDVSVYQAFDITCSYRGLEDHCSLNLKAGDLIATCLCCKSEFLLSADGYPTTKSTATRPLWMYNCTIMGNGLQLVVFK